MKHLPRTAGGAEKVPRQTNHIKDTMARRVLVDMEGNTGDNTKEKSCRSPLAGHRYGGGMDKKRQIPGM